MHARPKLALFALTLALFGACAPAAAPPPPVQAAIKEAAPVPTTSPVLAAEDEPIEIAAAQQLSDSRSDALPVLAPAPRERRPLDAMLRLKHAPFGEHPNVLVHAPDDLRESGPLSLVVFLHGWNGCVEVVAGDTNAPCTPGGKTRAAMGLRTSLDRAEVAALLVVPQMAFDVPLSAPGRFIQDRWFKKMLDEVLASPEVALVIPEGTTTSNLGRVVIFAHSAGYMPLAQIMVRGGVNLDEIHLLDALYQEMPMLGTWASKHAKQLATGDARMTITYTDKEKTGERSLRHLDDAAARVPNGSKLTWTGELARSPQSEALAAPLSAMQSFEPHEAIPRQMLTPLLRTAHLTPLMP